MIAGLHASIRKFPHTSSIQTINKTFPAIDYQLRGTGTFKPLAINWEERDPFRHLDCVEEKSRCQHETNSSRVKCCADDCLESTAWADAVPIPFPGSPGLKPADCPAWETSCQWFVQHSAEPPFLLSVLFSNEAGIGRHDIINVHNHHQWTEDNHYGILHSVHQQQFIINVAGAIVC
jgi:hypothetical protein